MRTSIDSENLAEVEEYAPRDASSCSETPTIILELGPAGNDAFCEESAAFEDGAEPWVRHAPVAYASSDRTAGDAATPLRPTSYELHRAARANRSLMLGDIIIAVFRAAGASARQAYARYRQRQEARATCAALRDLDDRMLRDLGLDRSEITSIAAEMTGEAEHTRVRALLRSHGLP